MTAAPTKHDAVAWIRGAVVAGYVSGGAVLLWPLARLASGRPEGIAPHIADGIIMLAASLWLQKRRSTMAAVVLVIFSVTTSYFRYLASGNILTIGFGLLLAYIFVNGVLAARRIRVQGSSGAPAGP